MTDRGETKVVQEAWWPLQRPGVGLRREGEIPVLYDGEGERLWALNESALALWQLCDGETSVEEMIDAICAICSVNPDQARADVDSTLDAFASAELILWRHAG